MTSSIEIPDTLVEHARQFTGRAWLLAPILAWLDHTDERLFLLTGDPGAGKSMVAAWLTGAGPMPANEADRATLEAIRARVRAGYFCSVAAGNLSPGVVAERLAGQLTRNVIGFADALATTLSDRVQIVASASAPGAQAGVIVTGLNIGVLNLGALGDEAKFDRVLREPLRKLYASGFDEPLLLIVDGLDEALVYAGANLVQLLARLGDLPAPIRIIVTSRPDQRVLSLLRDVRRLDLVDDAPHDQDDIRDYAFERLAELQNDPRRAALADTVSTAAEGYFLYAHLVLNDLVLRLPAVPELTAAQLPSGLPGLYQDFLNRELGANMQRWFDVFRPVLGLVAVAQAGGLERAHLDQIAAQDSYQALLACKQYLDGALPDGPFRLFHRSFSEFLLEDQTNTSFHIDAARSHSQIVNYYWPPQANGRPWEHWDAYGMGFMPAHLAGSTRGGVPADRHRQTKRLVQLVLNTDFQTARLAEGYDEAQLRRDIGQALRVAAADQHPETPALLVEAALGLQRLRTEQSQPQTIFERARRGDLYGAEQRLALFDAEPYWRQAIRLILAWLAADHDIEAARRARDQVAKTIDNPDVRLLLQRLDVDLLHAPMPTLPQFYPPDEYEVIAILERMGGNRNVTGLEPLRFDAEGIVARPEAGQSYIAEQDSLPLVAFAADGSLERTRFLRQYLALHAGNNYIVYRNRSLWAILRAVLVHPHQVWVRDLVEELGAAALAGSRLEFRHAVGLTIRALLARAGQADVRQTLNAYTRQLLDTAPLAAAERGEGDPWGHYMRRMASLAELYATLLDDPDQAAELLTTALTLPYGFAGFRAQSCLALAGTIQVCRLPTGQQMIDQALAMALIAAHNIQDYAFCARSTTRVNAMQRRRWAGTGQLATDAIIQRFCDDPDHADFAAIHRVGETYLHRDRGPHKLPIPPRASGARTLADLCWLYGCSTSEILNLNHDQPWTLDQLLGPCTEVSVPDREWIAVLAAQLAAELLAAEWLGRSRQVALLQRLVPIAAAGDTTLDTVLARLLIAAVPGDLPVLLHLGTLVSLADPADPQAKFDPINRDGQNA